MSERIERDTQVTLKSEYCFIQYDHGHDVVHIRTVDSCIGIPKKAIDTLLLMLTEARDAP